MNTAKVEPAAAPKQIRQTAAIGRETREIPASQFGPVRGFDEVRDDAGPGRGALRSYCPRNRAHHRSPQLTSQILVDWNQQDDNGDQAPGVNANVEEGLTSRQIVRCRMSFPVFVGVNPGIARASTPSGPPLIHRHLQPVLFTLD